MSIVIEFNIPELKVEWIFYIAESQRVESTIEH